MSETPGVINNKAERQFEIHVDGYMGKLTYNTKDDMIAFFHTEVPDALQGRGLAKMLAEYALNYAKEHNLKILPYCPFVAKYIKEHPEWQQYVKHF
jgi:predicted GNAT family acetyltransferase